MNPLYFLCILFGLYSRDQIQAGRTARATADPRMSINGHHRYPVCVMANHMVVAPYPVMPSAALMTANRSAQYAPRATLTTPMMPDAIMARLMVVVSGFPAASLIVKLGLMILSAPNTR